MRYFNLLKNLSNWPLYLLVKFNLTKMDPLLFQTRSGVRVEVPLRLLQTFKEIFMDECYLRGLGRPLPKNPTILDIGANAGYFSLFVLSRFRGARVFAFEPIPANFALLVRNRLANAAQGLTCMQKAVSGQSGELILNCDADDGLTTSATVLDLDATSSQARIRVPAVTLAEIFEEYGLSRCDLMKLDCEGAEYDILYRCLPETLDRIDRIAMEVHRGSGEGQNIDAMEEYLKKAGFVTRRRPVGMLWAWREEKADE
jgi:FkbM family methyltransferase